MNATLTWKLRAAMSIVPIFRVVQVILRLSTVAATPRLIALYFELCSLTNFTLVINKTLYSFIIEFLFHRHTLFKSKVVLS